MTRALSSTLPHRKTFRLAWRIKPTTSQDCIHQRPHLYSHFSKTPRFFPIQSMKTTLLQRNVLEMSRGGHVDSVDATESNITCCSNGGCCRTGQFCIKHGPGCCYDNDRECGTYVGHTAQVSRSLAHCFLPKMTEDAVQPGVCLRSPPCNHTTRVLMFMQKDILCFRRMLSKWKCLY